MRQDKSEAISGGGGGVEHNKTQISKEREGTERLGGETETWTESEREFHTWLIRRTALEPDKDMNVSFLTLSSSPSSLGTLSDARRHKSGIHVAVGAREERYVRQLFDDVSPV